jgi:hypothetical protein
VKRKARQRIEEAADRMAAELLKMATNDNVADSVKLAAIRDALDRAGLAAKNAVEVEVGPPKPYETILDSIEAGSAPSTAEASADLTTTALVWLHVPGRARAGTDDRGLHGYTPATGAVLSRR